MFAQLIVHSDQGWHYKMQAYRTLLVQRGVNCFDSAAIESFFGTLKAGYFHLAVRAALMRSERACTLDRAGVTEARGQGMAAPPSATGAAPPKKRDVQPQAKQPDMDLDDDILGTTSLDFC